MSSETRQAQPRYWCHICNGEVAIYMAPDPTCQQCNEQFIEELQSDDDPREFLAGDNNQDDDRTASGHIHLPGGGAAHFFSYSPSTGRVRNLNNNSERTETEAGNGSIGEMGDDIFQYFAPRSAEGNQEERSSNGQHDQPPTPISNFVQNLLTNMLGQNVDLTAGGTPTGEGHERPEEGEAGRPMIFFGNMVDGNVRFEPMPAGAGRMPGSMPRNREGEDNNNNNNNENSENNTTPEMRGNSIASILQFLSAMTGAPIDGGLVGNPNDYVFSQTALDNIITQLMEQAGSASAPPPAPEQVIDSLPKRSLTDKEKAQEIDCAVCKDNFEPTEQVIELPCLHIFHDDCIKPWLKLNGTCPVCRHSVVPEQEPNSNDNSNDNSSSNSNGNNNGDNN
ncbi:putative RING finger protein P32A8.03c, partial [Choanephora cucurbitarum]